MAIALVAFAVAFRYFSPHYVWPQYQEYPVVPAITALMLLGVTLSLIRKKTAFGFPAILTVQWILLVWAFVCRVINDGAGGLGILSSDYPRDMVFITFVVIAVDNLRRFKILFGGLLATFFLIGLFGLPQTWGERMCAEWKEGDMANLVFSGKSCGHISDCFQYEKKIPRAFEGIGSRNWRCERRGPFNIAAYIGRVRWTGVFDDSNNLGGAVGMLIPLVMAWFWRNKKWYKRYGWPALALWYAAVIVGTGSRGAQLGMILGAGVTLWGLWGRKAVYLGVAAVILAVVATLVFGKLMVREQNKFEGSTKVSDRYRRDALAAGYRLWGGYPIFGVGHQQFEKYHLIDPHNAFMATAGELGTPGLLFYGLGLWIMFKAMWIIRRRSKELGRKDLEYFAMGMIGADLAGITSLAFFLSTYDKFSWLVPVALNAGFYRAALRELPELGFKFTYKDLLYSAPISLLMAGIFYVGLMASYTYS